MRKLIREIKNNLEDLTNGFILFKIESFSNKLYKAYENPDTNKRLEDFFSKEHETEIFENGLEKKIKFSIIDTIDTADLEEIGLERSEVLEILKFLYLYAEFSHRRQKRRSGRDYIEHPKDVAINTAKYGVSWVTVGASKTHDVVEERSKNELKKGGIYTFIKERAIFYSLCLDLYNFVKQSNKIKEENKPKIYRNIHVFMHVMDGLTDLGRTSYFDYLRSKIFYREHIKVMSDSLFNITPLDIIPFLGRFYRVSDINKFVRDYIEDVHKVKLDDDEVKKTKRRILNIKGPDVTTYIAEMEGLPISFRFAQYFKGTVIAHEVGLVEHRPERQRYIKRMQNQRDELRARFLKEVKIDRERLRKLIPEDYAKFIDHLFHKYVELRGTKRLTPPNKKENINETFKKFKRGESLSIRDYRRGNPFDGTLMKYGVALVEGNGNPYERFKGSKEELNRQLYVDTILFEWNIERLESIEGFSLKNIDENYEGVKKKYTTPR